VQLLHDRLCLVTEWASGGTLASFLAAPRYARGAPEQLAAFMMRQLVAAVERLHAHRVAYRDIKVRRMRCALRPSLRAACSPACSPTCPASSPARRPRSNSPPARRPPAVRPRAPQLDNILLDLETFGPRAPRLLLADFGTCKSWDEGAPGCLTQTFMGTPGFMAPQILRLLSLHRDGDSPAPPPEARSCGSGMDDSAAEVGARTLGSADGLSDDGASSSSLDDSDDDADGAASEAAAAPSRGARAAASAAAAGAAAGRSRVYDAVKADIYSMGAILMYMLFGQLPYGFDQFSRLLPPREALTVLWTLESQQTWREAAGSVLLARGVSKEALDLLDAMLHPDEAARIDVDGIKAHPWFAQRLPRRYEAALEALGREQAELDGARRVLRDRSDAARRRASLEVPAWAASGSGSGGRGRAAGPGPLVPARGASEIEAATEELFAAAADPAALRRLRERRASLFVDLTPDAVADAWALGVQTEGARAGSAGGGASAEPRAAAPAAAWLRSCFGGRAGAAAPAPAPVAAPPAAPPAAPASPFAAAVRTPGPWMARPSPLALGAPCGGEPDADEAPWSPVAGGVACSVAGRSDSATSCDLPAGAGPCCDKALPPPALGLGCGGAAGSGAPALGARSWQEIPRY
jgi:serine/threonine protein kinase